jgi:hypothetical protein
MRCLRSEGGEEEEGWEGEGIIIFLMVEEEGWEGCIWEEGEEEGRG